MSDAKMAAILAFFQLLILSVAGLQNIQLHIEENYNMNQRPSRNTSVPIQVNASINIRNILSVDEKAQILSLETTLRFFWYDDRIKPKKEHLEGENFMGKYTSLHPSIADKIWIPDVFIDQAKNIRIPKYLIKPASIRVFEDSRIWYSSRLNFDVACNMDFSLYPVDSQVCLIKFESFGHQSYQMKMDWLPLPHGLTYNENITLPQFTSKVELLHQYSTDYYDTAYPGLMLKVTLYRQVGYHFVMTYVPSILFVTLAWFSLFIPAEAVPGRVGMTMTTMLTLTAMFASVRYHVPPVSYCTYLDVWMLVCILTVFSTILEFIAITTLNRLDKKQIGMKFERGCLLAIPALFVLFAVVYFSYMQVLSPSI